ncbi:MAG: YicC family protein [Oscillospiraceae bacterium]|nr:YicC family protein [Oscillospiraceae bacterium]
MLKSMTGFGRAAVSAMGIEFTLELRAVNHRYLDINARVPRIMAFAEDVIKSAVTKRLSRGKIDAYLSADTRGADIVKVSLNKSVARSYYDALIEMRDEMGLPGEVRLEMLARMPEVFSSERGQLDAEETAETVINLTNAALDELEAMRLSEGERLCRSILDSVTVIEELAEKAGVRTPIVAAEYRAKLETRMRELLGTAADEARLLTEAAIFADKIANNEELVRLGSHISELRAMLKKNGAYGRKADFLMQEFNREVNTVGSKGNDAELSRIVVDLKAEIEKIREQVQNLE